MGNAPHWNEIHGKRAPEEQGWFAPVLQPSLDWIIRSGAEADDPILDAGGGAGRLVDSLLDHGFRKVSVLDISRKALDLVRERVGERASDVQWLCQDILEPMTPDESYTVWHDRAVFHFLHSDWDRERYRSNVERCVRPGGMFIIGTFSPEAPPTCSGLPVRRHTAEELTSWFSDAFEVQETSSPVHVTPSGVKQPYVFIRFGRKA